MSYVVHDEPLRLDLTRRDLGVMLRALVKVYCGDRDPHTGWAQHLISEYARLITPDDRKVIYSIIERAERDLGALGDHDDATEWLRIAAALHTLNIEDGIETTPDPAKKKKSIYDDGA